MRPILRSPAVVLLLILAIPVVSIAIALAIDLRPPALSSWYLLWAIACGLVGIVLIPVARSRAPKPDQPIDERRIEDYMRLIVVAFAVAIDAFALVFATGSLTVPLAMVAVAAIWVVLWVPHSTRALTTRSSVVIRRDPAVVFAFVADSLNAPKYLANIESVEKITSGPIGPGTQFRTRVHILKTSWDGLEEIVDYEPHARLTSRVVSGQRPNLEVLTFEPAQGGGTLLIHRFESEITYNEMVCGAGLLRWSAKPQMVAERQAGWAKLKQILESADRS